MAGLGWVGTREWLCTVQWYREHESWWRRIKTGEYLEYYKKQYGENG